MSISPSTYSYFRELVVDIRGESTFSFYSKKKITKDKK